MAKVKDIESTSEIEVGKFGDTTLRIKKGPDGKTWVVFEMEDDYLPFKAETFYKLAVEGLRHICLLERHAQ